MCPGKILPDAKTDASISGPGGTYLPSACPGNTAGVYSQGDSQKG